MPYKNHEDRLAWQKRRTLEAANYLKELKETTACSDCDDYFPHYVMEFDHARGIKIKNLPEIARNKGIRSLAFLEEIEKCDIVCANCHKTRTWNRNQQGAIHLV